MQDFFRKKMRFVGNVKKVEKKAQKLCYIITEVKNMRKMDFRMERPGLVKPGDHVELKEDVANTMAGIMYYYTIREAIAMSNNTKQRLKCLEGTVSDVIEEEGIFTVWVEIPE